MSYAAVGLSLAAAVLSACGAGAPVGSPHSTRSGPRAGSAEAAEDTDAAVRCRTWPSRADDPRRGVYVFDHFEPGEGLASVDPAGARRHSTLLFDGETVTGLVNGFVSLPPACVYGELEQVLGLHFLRLHARLLEDGRLFALAPCWGWQLVGRFEGERLVTARHAVARRLAVGDYDALRATEDGSRADAQLFRCQEVWTAPGEPIPTPPPDAPPAQRSPPF